MVNEISKRKNTEVANPAEDVDFFSAIGQELSTQYVIGKLLKYIKGDWIVGDDDKHPLPAGTKMCAIVTTMMVGWVKWSPDRLPIEQLEMYVISEGQRPPKRDTLGDMDREQWLTDEDPWKLSIYMVFADAEDQLYTYRTNSDGGHQAIGEVCKAYGPRRHGGEFPVVELGTDSYEHKNKAWGKVEKPMLPIKNWIAAEPLLTLLDGYKINGGEPVVQKPARKKITVPKGAAPKAAAPAPAKKYKGGKSPNFP